VGGLEETEGNTRREPTTTSVLYGRNRRTINSEKEEQFGPETLNEESRRATKEGNELRRG
jgi:hypothetical protein